MCININTKQTNELTDGRDCQVAAMCWYEIAKVLTRPWRGGAPGLSRPPPWGQLLESTWGGGQHPFYESEQKLYTTVRQ